MSLTCYEVQRRHARIGGLYRLRTSSAQASFGCCDFCRQTSRYPTWRDRSTSPSIPSTPISAESTPSSAPVTAVRPCDEHASSGSLPAGAPHHRRSEFSVRARTNHHIPVTTAHSVESQNHRVIAQPGCQYLIRIRGRLGATALSAFPTMGSEVRAGETVLTGSLEDRSAVYGVLAQIEALGLRDSRTSPSRAIDRPRPWLMGLAAEYRARGTRRVCLRSWREVVAVAT
jgi:hypothetical protein